MSFNRCNFPASLSNGSAKTKSAVGLAAFMACPTVLFQGGVQANLGWTQALYQLALEQAQQADACSRTKAGHNFFTVWN